MKYFFDSYALIEIFKGSHSYYLYADAEIVTAYFNLYETYYHIRKEKTEEESEEFFKSIQPFCIALKFSWLKETTEMRLKMKKKNFSYVDCLGYIIAKNSNIKFLTGDRQFKHIDNVELVR